MSKIQNEDLVEKSIKVGSYVLMVMVAAKVPNVRLHFHIFMFSVVVITSRC